MTPHDAILEPENNEDEVLKIFFDESFVPQAFVDILLSNAAEKDINQVQFISSSLLGRLDYYTKHLTKELESTIRRLEHLSETLPGTWVVDGDDMRNEEHNSMSSRSIRGSSKLEYYLDTLGSAVRALEADVTKVDQQLDQLSIKHENSQVAVNKLQKLKIIKERLLKVSYNFNTLRTILDISSGSRGEGSSQQQLHINISDFKVSLETLEDTITQSLIETSKKESSSEKNLELLKKIEVFTELLPLFKGLDKFYPLYFKFSNSIEQASQAYIGSKDLELNVQ